MCLNPYLALGMTTAAAVAGVVPGASTRAAPLNKDLYAVTDEEIRAGGGQRLPRNLLEATEILKDDPAGGRGARPDDAALLAAVQGR